MILGVIFAIPIINKFIQYSNEKEIEYFILVFISFSIIKQLFNIFNIRYALDMTFFITPIPYLVLGYYLSTKNFDISSNKILILSLLTFIVTTLIKIPTFQAVSPTGFYTSLDLTLIQIIQATSVFLFIKNLYSDNISKIFQPIRNILNKKYVEKFILSVSKSSYGMYFIQQMIIFTFVNRIYKGLSLTGTQSLI